jgi:hypothetical protein
VNGKFYIGKHTTKNLDDSYSGSNRHLKNAIAKYGAANFVMFSLRYCSTSEKAYAYEERLISKELMESDKCYNHQGGGKGFASGIKHHVHAKVKNGTHNFLKRPDGSSVGRNTTLANVKSGKNPLLKRPDGSSVGGDTNLSRLAAGTFVSPFSTRPDGSSISGDNSKRRVKEGVHNWLTRPDGTNSNTDRVLAGTHHFIGIRPWCHPSATKRSLFTWSMASRLYQIYRNNAMCGFRQLYALATKAFTRDVGYLAVYTVQTVLRYFRNGWVPRDDAAWVSFERNHVLG